MLAPCVELEGYKEYLKGRILSTPVVIKGVNITILNGYAPTDEAPIASNQLFYRSLTKAKADLAKLSLLSNLSHLGTLMLQFHRVAKILVPGTLS